MAIATARMVHEMRGFIAHRPSKDFQLDHLRADRVTPSNLPGTHYPRKAFTTFSFASASLGDPWKIISPRSMAYSRSPIRVAAARWDSAIRIEMPIALIFITASIKRL